MTDRHDLPKIRPDKAPSALNSDAIMGAWLGGSIATILYEFADLFNKPAQRSRGSTVFMAIVGSVAGAIIGGRAGEKEQVREQQEGRIVKTPSFWNRGMITGFLAGDGLGHIINMARGPNALHASKVNFSLVAAGGIIGSVLRQGELQRDFDKATMLHAVNLVKSQTPHSADAPRYKDSVSPQEAAALAAAHEAPTAHADKLTEQAVAHDIAGEQAPAR